MRWLPFLFLESTVTEPHMHRVKVTVAAIPRADGLGVDVLLRPTDMECANPETCLRGRIERLLKSALIQTDPQVANALREALKEGT